MNSSLVTRHASLQWLSRLLPPRLRTREVLDAEQHQRRALLANVQDNDPCLRAVLDRLQETMESEFLMVIDTTRSAEERLRACEGLRVCFYQLKFIEEERAAAIEWKNEQQANARSENKK